VAAHLLRLRLDLLLGAVRGDRRHIVRTVVTFVVFAVAVTAVCWGALQLRGVPDETAYTVTVLAASAVVLAIAVAPLVGGFDDPLDPRRFAVFGAAPRPLAGWLLLASVISVPVLALVAIVVCVAIMGVAHGVAPWLAVLGAALVVITCLLLSKIAGAIAVLVLRERRSRELSGLFLVALLVVVVPVVVFLASLEWGGAVPSQLAEAAHVLAVTPLGAATAFPGQFAGIGTAQGWTSLLVAVGTVLGLALIWFGLVQLLLTTTERPTSGRERRGLGWFVVMPGTPAGAIAARSLIYWLRDPRYLVNLIVVPIAAVLTIVPLLIVGVPLATAALLPVPVMALFFGWLAHNDLAYDSTAVWMHIAGAVRGVSDRVGRLVPVTLIAVPLLAISVPIAIWLHGRWALLPALIGVTASLFLCGLGLSSLSSVLAPYPVSRPGDSPFQQPQRTGGGLAQGAVLAGAVILSAPALWWGWLSLSDSTTHARTAFTLGVGVGVAVLVLGILLGGWAFSRRTSRIMEFAEST